MNPHAPLVSARGVFIYGNLCQLKWPQFKRPQHTGTMCRKGRWDMNIPPNRLEYASVRYTSLVVVWTLCVEERAALGQLLNEYAAAIDTLAGIEAKVQAQLEKGADLRAKS